MENNDAVPKPERKRQTDISAMRNEFRAAVERIVETTATSDQASACVDAVIEHLGRLGIHGVNSEYARRDFQWALDEGHPLVERCMDWWDEVASGIRWPVAICHVVTGKLPGGYVQHTVAAMSVYGRDGKPVAHGAVEWGDFSSTELTDKQSYGGFNRAISAKAAELGARSMFEFAGECLRKSVSIVHDSERGPMWFDDRRYGNHAQGEVDELEDGGGSLPETSAVAGSVSDDGDRPDGGEPEPNEDDFFGALKKRAKKGAEQRDDEEANEHEIS